MEPIGEILRSAREGKNITLREAEEATKIRFKYLAALENNDYDQIPGRVYVLGFLRNYADYLGLEARELTERYKKEYPAKDDIYSLAEDKNLITRPASQKTNYLLLVLGVIVFLWGVNWLYSSYQSYFDRTPLPPVTDVKPSPDPQPNEQEPTPPPEPQIEGIEVKIEAKGNCWTEVVTDAAGSFSFYGMLQAGDKQVFQGKKEISLRLGSAGMVDITVNGRTWPPLGATGEIIDIIFKPDSIPPDINEGDRDD